jgi:hypothetical protein
MSSASKPVPRNKPGSTRFSLFWPILILMIGLGTQAVGQIMMLEDQLDKVTRAVDQMDAKVKHAQYEKTKFYSIASHVLRLAPQNANAEQIVKDLQLRKLQAAQPALMSMNTPSSIPESTPAPSTNTVNPPTIAPSEATNARPQTPVVPGGK